MAGGGHHEDMVQHAKRLLHARAKDLESRAQGPGAKKELEEVREALARIDLGTWGRCEHCAAAIGRDRLRALPETRTCLDCTR